MFAVMTAKNLLSSCCDANLFSKVFGNDHDDEDVHQPTKPSAATNSNNKPSFTGGHKKYGFTDKQAKYEDVNWSKMNVTARKAAKAIGFDQKEWDNKEWLPIDDKHWHDLTTEEKTAVETLGWTMESWEHKYEHCSWKDMPKEVQKAAEKLGWNETKWDDDWDVDSWDKDWNDFTPEEQRCLHVMGYTYHTWD